MFILSRYVIREHIGPFLFSATLLTSMLVLNFVLQAMRYIIGKGIGWGIIGEFILYNLAGILVLVVPMAVLISTIMSYGRLASDNEVTAIKAGGIPFLKLIFPMIIVSFLLTLFVFWFNDKILPIANHRARVLKKNIQTKRPTLSIEPGVFLEDIDNFTMIAENKDEIGNELFGVTIFDKSDRSVFRTITAERGELTIDDASESMILTLKNGELHEFKPASPETYQKVFFQQYKVVVPVDNLSLKKNDESFRNDREKNVNQLMEEVVRYVKERERQQKLLVNGLKTNPEATKYLDDRHKAQLYRTVLDNSISQKVDEWFLNLNLKRISDTVVYEPEYLDSPSKDPILKAIQDTAKNYPDSVRTRYMNLANQMTSNLNTINSYQRLTDQCMVEVNKKYSIPVACIIFVLLGAPIGVKAKKGNLGIAGGISLFFFIAYYFCLILGEDFADRQLLNPFMAMWFMNIILGILGIYLIFQTTTEKKWWQLIKIKKS